MLPGFAYRLEYCLAQRSKSIWIFGQIQFWHKSWRVRSSARAMVHIVPVFEPKTPNSQSLHVKKRFPKQATGGGLTSSRNKKGLRGRMITRVGAFESSELGASSRYLKHASQTSGKFSRSLWSKNVRQKPTKLHINLRNFELNIDGISQKSPFCYFSCNKKGLWRRMVTKVSAFESSDFGALLRYLKHPIQTSRKFFRSLWSRSGRWKTAQIHFTTSRLKLGFYLIFPKIALLLLFLQ